MTERVLSKYEKFYYKLEIGDGQMDEIVQPGRLCGEVKAIPSKSMAHRALICAALADNPCHIECDGESGDIKATVDCLTALGAIIRRVKGGYEVNPLRHCAVAPTMNVNESTKVTGASIKSVRAQSNITGESSGDAESNDVQEAVPDAASNDVREIAPITELNAVCETAPITESNDVHETAPDAASNIAGAAAVVLPCGESGSTFRFLLPIVCAFGRDAMFHLEGRLPERPISPLYEELVRHGCSLSPKGSVPFQVSGRLSPGQYTLDAGVSSQFISGLLFALPLLDGDSELFLTGQAESIPYINMTVSMLEEFGIKIEFDDSKFKIPGNQIYRSPGIVRVEGDWSNAAFWLAAGAIAPLKPNSPGDGITCVGLDMRSRQGDREIVEILKRFGARVEISDTSATVYPGGRLRGITIDARDIPDLVPILAVVGAAAEGTTVIRNAGRLRIKESDRLSAISAALNAIGAEVRESEDSLTIKGGAALKGGLALKVGAELAGGAALMGGAALAGGVVSSRGDHRIAMSMAIAASICENPVVIQGAEAVNKSYPQFFDDLKMLTGRA